MTAHLRLDKIELKNTVSEDPLLLNFFTMLSDFYQTNRREITLHNICKRMREMGLYNEPNNRQMWKALLKLEICNCGKRIKGSRGHSTRFLFFYDMLDLAEYLLVSQEDTDVLYREVQIGEAFEPSLSHEENDLDDDDIWLTHTVKLRKNADITLSLPFSLSENQAQRLSDLVSSAVLNDGQNGCPDYIDDELDYRFYLDPQTYTDITLPNDLSRIEAIRMSSFFDSLVRDNTPSFSDF